MRVRALCHLTKRLRSARNIVFLAQISLSVHTSSQEKQNQHNEKTIKSSMGYCTEIRCEFLSDSVCIIHNLHFRRSVDAENA